MRDLDIRLLLRELLVTHYPGDLIRGELGLCLGETRVDLAVVNGHLHGYEIKSSSDTLSRLPAQSALYDRVLDYSTVVCASRHVEGAAALVPSHWGLIEAIQVKDQIRLKTARRARINRGVDKLALAQLLWRDEAASVLHIEGQTTRRRETRWDLWSRLANLPLRNLQSHVRATLTAREDWPGG